MSAASSTPRGPAAPGPSSEGPEPGRWGRRLTALIFLGPAAVMLLVWLVYPTIATIWRSLFDKSGDHFVWFQNYVDIFTTENLTTALQNNVVWVAVVPALVTAIGLVLAVLIERIRWQVAFRLAIFMPMAISLFAAGVIWRIMDEKDPTKGTINASIAAVESAFGTSGVLERGKPSDPELMAGSVATGYVLKARVQPGSSALLGLTGIPPATMPAGAKQAATPAPSADTITGTIWRDFKPGGGEAGVVEVGENGIPGATIALRQGGEIVQTVESADDGGFTFKRLKSGEAYTVAINKETFAAPFEGVSWLGPKLITPAVMIAYIWVWAGFSMVIIAAGLASISREVLEAARTDGATEWQVFRRVTAPMLAPILSVVFITMLINVLKVFDIILSIAPASSQDDANVIALAMWRTSFGGVNDFGLGSAIAVFLLLLVMPALFLNVRRFKREQ